MGRYNVESEYIFNLYQAFNTRLFEDELGVKIQGLVLEEYYCKSIKVDLYGKELTKNKDIFFEVQLDSTFKSHRDKVKRIIDIIDAGIVIWEAVDFDKKDKIINQVIRYASDSGKKVDFYAVEINKEILPLINKIRQVHVLKVMEAINRLKSVKHPIQIISKYECIPRIELKGLRDKGDIEVHDLGTRGGVNRYLLQKIRTTIPYYPGVYRQKTNLDSNTLTIGALNSNTYFLGESRRNFFVELRFSKANAKILQEIYEDREVIEPKIGYPLEFNRENLKVGVYFSKRTNDKEETLTLLVYVLERFIKNFTDYICCNWREKKGVG